MDFPLLAGRTPPAGRGDSTREPELPREAKKLKKTGVFLVVLGDLAPGDEKAQLPGVLFALS